MTNSAPPNSPTAWQRHSLPLLLAAYRRKPDLYARQVLGVRWWQKQEEIAAALLQHKRVLVKASHAIGKTHVAAGLVNWHFDCFQPGITISTAPTGQQVVDVLWKEVRVQRQQRPGLQPKAPRMETSAEHFAVGYTARDDNAFQGRHSENVLIVFDEATGIEGPFWDAAEGMMTGENCYWLAILNPTDTSSRAYEEEQSGKFHVITISALDHPNIAAELAGQPPPYPAAVRLSWVVERLKEWCEPLPARDNRASDIEFPPGSGQWYRPGPLAESRMLGRWPTQGSVAVWSEARWNRALLRQEMDERQPTQIGCDVARFGDDFSEFLVRRGNCVLHHEAHNGWGTDQTAARLKALCKEFARTGEAPSRIPVKIDDDGIGGGVWDQRGEYGFLRVSAASVAIEADKYPNKRSELWFTVSERADEGRVDLSRLSKETLNALRRQVMAPTWKLDNQGRRVVEMKAETKKRLKRSPDTADALNLAFAEPRIAGAPVVGGSRPFADSYVPR